MDYNSLTAQIQSYANRTDAFFVDQIPNFINQAMNRLYCEAKSLGFQAVSPDGATLTPNQPLLNKPQNWRENVSFQINTGGPLSSYVQLRSYEFCTTYAPNSMATGEPKFYAEYSVNADSTPSQIYLAPTPDQAYPYRWITLQIPVFNAGNPRNFLTDKHPALLLYACLLEMTPFLRGDERVPVFESLYNRALQNINREAEERYVDRYGRRNKD
jgi:hypothetical protein